MITYRLYGNLGIQGIKTAFKKICDTTDKCLKLKEELIFDVNVATSKQIKYINKKYRKIDKVTDVLSFANRDRKDICVPLLGEIYICLSRAKQQATEFKHSLKREVCYLFTHGLLHLLGYDHQNKKQEKVMFGLTEKILKENNIIR